MGLDMYMFSLPRYPNKNEVVAPKVLMSYISAMEEVDIVENEAKRQALILGQTEKANEIPDVLPPTYDDYINTPPFSRDFYNFYRDKYILQHNRPKEWYYYLNNGIRTEIQYWRKAYSLAEGFLDKFYDDIENDNCSREITRQDIIDLQAFVNEKLAETANMKKGNITGYVTENGRIVFFENVRGLLIEYDDGNPVENEAIEIPIKQSLYTELPLEYIAKIEDDWELNRMLEAKHMCEKLLKEFDFENYFLVYEASY